MRFIIADGFSVICWCSLPQDGRPSRWLCDLVSGFREAVLRSRRVQAATHLSTCRSCCSGIVHLLHPEISN